MKKQPTVSVLLPVYNAEKYIVQSVESILYQTYRDFELIILNDGSHDNSLELLNQFTDERIVLTSHSNIGLGATLKKGMQLARGKYIARQDADDISLPERLEKQVHFLEKNPAIALVGTWARIMDENDKLESRFHQHAIDPKQLKFDLIFNNPFVHSSVLFNRQMAESVGGYADQRQAFEDYDLWSRISHRYPVSNLPEVLIHYREVSTGISKSNPDYDKWVIKICMENLKHYLPELAEETGSLIANVYHGKASDKVRMSDRFMEKLMSRLVTIVVPDASGTQRTQWAGRHIFQMKRKYYNIKIDALETGFMEKLWYKLKRKILFTFSPKNPAQ